jgi:hypothetical protein
MIKPGFQRESRTYGRLALFVGIGMLVLGLMFAPLPAGAEGKPPGLTAGGSTMVAAAPTPPPTPTPPAGEDMRIISGDQVITGDNFILHSNEALHGDLTVFGGNAMLEEGSRVEGNITVFGGNADISGSVTRNLTVIGGITYLRSSAQILGNENIMGGQIQRDPGAVVNGPGSRFSGPFFGGMFPFQGRSLFQTLFDIIGNIFSVIFSVFLITLLAIAVVALFPVNVARVAETAQQQWLVSGSVGILSFVAVPVVVAVLAVTICLIPAAVVLAIAWTLGILVGWAIIARICGERLAIGFNKRNWTMIGQTAFGAVALGLLGAIPIIGWLIGLAAAALGLGALILTRVGTSSYPPPTPVQPVGPPAQTPVLPA